MQTNKTTSEQINPTDAALEWAQVEVDFDWAKIEASLARAQHGILDALDILDHMNADDVTDLLLDDLRETLRDALNLPLTRGDQA